MRSQLHTALAAAIVVTFLLVQPVRTETATGKDALEGLFAAETVNRNSFAPDFLAKISAEQVTQIIAGLKRDNGPLLGVDDADGGFVLRFGHARIPARISLDPNGRIAGLWFGLAQAEGDTDTFLTAIKALPGRSSLLITTDGQPVAAHEATTPLAVGSAAKLAVLLALKRAVAQKRLAWDTVVKLDPIWKSLPSGMLQEWPDGTPLTLATLAHLMMSISDNTATDALIRIVGRDAIAAISPRNTPFLTTRELFSLKTKENAPLRIEWRNGDPVHRQAILDRIDDTALPSADAISPAATAEVEWFMTAQELCDLLDATADLPSAGINAGPVDRKDWQSVAYKGGSEVGVLNLSSRLTDKAGRVSCVVATWNGDGPLDEGKLISLYRGIIARLAGRQN